MPTLSKSCMASTFSLWSASYTMGNGSFLGVKRPGRGIDHPPTSSIDVKERVGLYLQSTSGLSWPFVG